jgi:hypothetical protein
MTITSTYLEAFNSQLDEFIKDIKIVLANHYEVTLACHAITGLKIINKTLIISVWHEGITLVYMDQINAKDYEFFLEKDYSQDLKGNSYADQITAGINKIRNHLRKLNEEDKETVLKYVENLCRLSNLYYESLKNELHK